MSCDIFKNWLLPNAELKWIVIIGKINSLCTMALSFGIAIYLYQTKADYAVIGILQQSILWQSLPAYIFGLYTDLETNPVLYGIIVGIICDIILISVVFSGNDPFANYDPSLIILDKSWSSLIGVALNLIVCGIVHLFNKYKKDKNYKENIDMDNDSLSYMKIRNIMNGINEPITKYYGSFVWLIGIILFVTIFHWIDEIDQQLIDEYSLLLQVYQNGHLHQLYGMLLHV